jgi:hypothetical protein
MAKVSYDLSFVRDGCSLAQWFPELVSADLPTRKRAGDAIIAMKHGLPSVHTDYDDLEGTGPKDDHDEAWKNAVRAAFAAEGFPRREFVETAIDRMIALHDRRMDAWHK